jgi:hypothetical protein
MKIERNARLRYLSMLGIALTVALLASESKAASSTAPPYSYEPEADVLTMSNGCGKFPGGVVVPLSNVQPHKYVLLLVFNSETHARTAGTALFSVETSEFKTKFGCMVDPAMTIPAGAAIPNQGLKVKGGCPSDCLGPGMERALDSVPDPLEKLHPVPGPDGKPQEMHWGIFFGDPEHPKKSRVRVWQIRVANAAHAKQILEAMDADLSNKSKAPGYMGNLLIGYRPVVDPPVVDPKAKK